MKVSVEGDLSTTEECGVLLAQQWYDTIQIGNSIMTDNDA